jgi:hypothetical protein
MLDALDCRKQAAECRSVADTETRQPLKVALTNAAQSWSLLADQLVQLEVLTDRDTAAASRATMIAHVRRWLATQVVSV